MTDVTISEEAAIVTSTWSPQAKCNIAHGIIVGKNYLGTDAHHRIVKAVEYHFGNIQVHVYDSFYSKTEWLSLREWAEVNAKHSPSPSTDTKETI